MASSLTCNKMKSNLQYWLKFEKLFKTESQRVAYPISFLVSPSQQSAALFKFLLMNFWYNRTAAIYRKNSTKNVQTYERRVLLPFYRPSFSTNGIIIPFTIWLSDQELFEMHKGSMSQQLAVQYRIHHTPTFHAPEVQRNNYKRWCTRSF